MHLKTYPDQSLYPFLSVPHLIRRIQNALIRADEIETLKAKARSIGLCPLWHAKAGFGGPLNTFELIKAMIKEGAGASIWKTSFLL